MSKWLHWTPSTGTKDEPTKPSEPSKPTFEGFEGAKSAKIQKISPVAASHTRKSKGQRGHNSCVFKNGVCIFCEFEGKVHLENPQTAKAPRPRQPKKRRSREQRGQPVTPLSAPLSSEPIYITPACTCSKYPFPHVHAGSLPMNVQHMPGEDLFAMMKRDAAARQNKKANN